jgi:SpoVK/Ycf46/Vps4 family AAA+-type ATPase
MQASIEPRVSYSSQVSPMLYGKTARTDIKAFATIIRDSNHGRQSLNQVFLSPKIFDKLFRNRLMSNYYVQIANRVFRASKDQSLSNWKVLMPESAYHQVLDSVNSSDKGEETIVRPFEPKLHQIAEMKKMRFRVYQGGQLNKLKENGQKPSILEKSLDKLVRQQCGKQYLVLGQELFINHPVVGPLKVVVDRWDYEGSDQVENLTAQSMPLFGRFSYNTQIEFTLSPNAQLMIVSETDPRRLSRFHFRIQKVDYIAQREFDSNNSTSAQQAWKNGSSPLPLTVKLDDLSHIIRSRLQDKISMIGDTLEIQATPEWKYKVILDKVMLKRGFQEEGKNDPLNIQRGFQLQNLHEIIVIPHEDVILTNNQNIREASSVTMEIVDRDTELELGNNEFAWANVQAIIHKLKESNQPFTYGSKLVVELDDQILLLQVKKVSGPNSGKTRKSNLKPVWKFNNKTDVKFFPARGVTLELFDTDKPYKVEAMKVEVTVPSTGQGGGIFQMLFGGDNSSDPKIRISSEDIEKVFREAMPKDQMIHRNQVLTDITDKGDKIRFVIKEVNSEEKEGSKLKYESLYHISENTKITLVGEKDGNLVITKKPVDLDSVDVSKKLKQLGIGGLSDQFKDIIRKIILSKSKYAAHTKQIGQKPPRGILFSGPPGTGKTILARKLGEILGVSPENMELITGSNIWSKWLGDSEKKVRELFAPARRDQAMYGKDSPMHLLIIDEIDAFLQSRENATQRYETSVLNTFLAELDGISGQGEGSLDNIIVVGLTNHPDKLDSAVTRPGRLGTQVHIGIPDKDGRKEILEIHTTSIAEKGFLSPDFDFDQIVKLTVGRTGAFIEDLVRIAASFSLKRLFDNAVDADKIKGHPDALVTTKDFVLAYNEMINKEKLIKDACDKFVAQEKISADAIKSDLKKLNIVGVPENVVEFLLDLKLRQAYRNDLTELKHPFPKGVFLYGPTGTGKTKFVKSLKDLLGLDGLRFQYYSASQLWPLKPEAQKEKIESIIKPAKDSALDLKGEAQLHVVVIDEIDWMYWMHGETKESKDSSVLNNFLRELEGSLDESGVNLSNLLIIGVGRRNYKLPDAILSHGRFGKHVDMGLPNAVGRKEILQQLLSKHIDKELVDESTLNEIVSVTKDRSPAFLEGLVGESEIQWLRRINLKGLDVQKSKMELADFTDAFQKMTRDEPDRSYYN